VKYIDVRATGMMDGTMRVAILAGLLSVGAAAAEVTHGPILGRLGTDRIAVWVRTSRPSNFLVHYGTVAGRLDAVSQPGRTLLEHDNTGWVLITGLRPNTQYFYRVAAQGAPSTSGLGGSFRTLPDAAQHRNAKHNPKGLFNFRYEFACGNNQNLGGGLGPALPTFRTMLDRIRDKVHFAILNGDWLYEASRDYPSSAWMKQTGASMAPKIVDLAPSITGVWENYKVYLSQGKNLAEWHRYMPSFFTIDDHEILNDVYGTGTVGRRDRLTLFRDIGTQAWQDYLAWANLTENRPEIHFGRAQLKAGSDVLTDPEADFDRLPLDRMGNLHVHWGGQLAGVEPNRYDGKPADPNAGVYEIVERLDRNRLRIRPAAKQDGTPAYSVGSPTYYQFRIANAHFFLLDTRTFREMHDVRQRAKPGLTMIGKRQKAWLMEGMKKSDADFFFVVSSVNLTIPHVGGTPAAKGGGQRLSNKDDAWTVFLDEREQLIRFWDSLGKPVMALTGDLHNSFSIRVTDRVWEFASAPHNSRNHTAGSEGDRPANGPFDSFGRKVDIRWSSYFLDDVPGALARQPVYTVVQVNNVFNNAQAENEPRWITFPRPHVVLQFHDGFTGDLLYAETVMR
jgi:phosphodiesterase/alkaline phosphatase D-like protein